MGRGEGRTWAAIIFHGPFMIKVGHPTSSSLCIKLMANIKYESFYINLKFNSEKSIFKFKKVIISPRGTGWLNLKTVCLLCQQSGFEYRLNFLLSLHPCHIIAQPQFFKHYSMNRTRFVRQQISTILIGLGQKGHVAQINLSYDVCVLRQKDARIYVIYSTRQIYKNQPWNL